jgi:hypothetical protein
VTQEKTQEKTQGKTQERSPYRELNRELKRELIRELKKGSGIAHKLKELKTQEAGEVEVERTFSQIIYPW